jgi:hypothetical protein
MVQKANLVIPGRPWAMAYMLWAQVLVEGSRPRPRHRGTVRTGEEWYE